MKKTLSFLFALMLLAGTLIASAPSVADTAEPTSVRVFLATDRKIDEENALIRQRVIDDIGVDLDYLTVSSSEGDQQFTLLVASREKMDLMILTPLVYQQYARQGGFMDIKDEYPKYPTLVEQIPQSGWDRTLVDGAIYGVPKLNLEGKYNFYLRGDWLENLGLEVPKTIDELYTVLKAFVEQDPDGNGVADTYGYSTGNLMPLYGAFGIMGPYPANGGGIASAYYTLEGDKISANAISENYKEALQFIKKMYDEKLIDPEAFVIKGEQVMQKFANSQLGAFSGWWNNAGSSLYRNYDMENLAPDAKILMLDPPTGKNGASGMGGQDPLNNVIAVSRDTTVLDAALRYLDYSMTDNGWKTLAWGVEGTHWLEDDAGLLTHIAVLNQTDVNGKSIIPENLELYSPLIRWDIYPNRYFLTDMVSVHNKEGLIRSGEIAQIRDVFVGLVTEEAIAYIPDLSKYEQEMMLGFILGSESLDNWDAYVSQWKALGGEEVRQSLLKAYNEQYGTSYTFLED